MATTLPLSVPPNWDHLRFFKSLLWLPAFSFAVIKLSAECLISTLDCRLCTLLNANGTLACSPPLLWTLERRVFIYSREIAAGLKHWNIRSWYYFCLSYHLLQFRDTRLNRRDALDKDKYQMTILCTRLSHLHLLPLSKSVKAPFVQTPSRRNR